MHENRLKVKGNRLVLIGALLYLLEWVAIVPAGDTGPVDPGTKSGAQILALYAHHPPRAAFIASWCSLVLFGRVLIVIGVRKALASVGADGPLMMWAMAAMTASVVLEVVDVALVGGGASLAAKGGGADIVVALDAVAAVLWRTVFAPLGLAVALSAWCMLRSRAFASWICWVGLLGGAVMMIGGALSGPGYVQAGFSRAIGEAAGVGVPLFWLWMLATGVVLLRRGGQSQDRSALNPAV